MVVIDSNVLAYLLIQGDKTALAAELFELDNDWRSDEFALIEFTNILATYVRRAFLTEEIAGELLAKAEELMSGVTKVANSEVLAIASKNQVSAYDARFLAAASHYGRVLVTEDKKLRSAAPTITISIEDAIAGLRNASPA